MPGPRPAALPSGPGTDVAAVARQLAARAPGGVARAPDVTFSPLVAEDLPPGRPAVAVDGSHAVVADNGAIWVVAWRAAAVAWPGPPAVEPQARLAASSPDEAQARLDDAYAAAGFEAPTARNAEAFASALCGLEEWRAAVDAIRRARPGDLVLVDGALLGLPRHAQAMADRLREEARARGVRLLGVAKSTRTLHGGAPLLPLLHGLGPTGAWSTRYEGFHVVRLHARAGHSFRVDGAEGDLGLLVPLARDAVYTGYPYPLALAHNTVALTGAHTQALAGALEDAAHLAGAGAVAALRDFHAVLDRNVPA